MAKVHPSMPFGAALSAGEAAELDVVRRLASGLPDAFTVFHSVEWSSGSGDAERHGEVDVIVANQAGDLLLLEVKSGGAEFRPDGIFKRYGRQTKDVTAQVRQQYAALRARLQQAGLSVRLHHMLVLPDLQVQSQTVQWPRERIVDCDDLETLVPRVTEQLGAGNPGGAVLPRVLAFLDNQFRVAPDPSAMSGRLQEVSTRLSAGLATWVPRLSVPSGLIRVVGTAGSGKTQLALRLLRDADAAGQRATYICFNRALADHIARVAPVRVLAETFHQHALRVCRRRGMAIDFALPGMFDRLAQGCIAALRDADPDLDLLVLDEGQDLQPEWVEAQLARLRPHGRAVLMEDPNQRLYEDRVPFELPEAVTVTSLENFRTPRAVVRLINLLGLCDEALEPKSPCEGEAPDPIVFRDEADGLRATQSAVERCLERGFPIDQIAVVSLRGRERSALQQADRLGPWSVRRFAGTYDEGGDAVWTRGDLLVESVRRFKGQAAPAVV
ncbi:MAG: hypothetical protein RLZZ451_1145, partial [Pseudomonadota bacterium]